MSKFLYHLEQCHIQPCGYDQLPFWAAEHIERYSGPGSILPVKCPQDEPERKSFGVETNRYLDSMWTEMMGGMGQSGSPTVHTLQTLHQGWKQKIRTLDWAWTYYVGWPDFHPDKEDNARFASAISIAEGAAISEDCLKQQRDLLDVLPPRPFKNMLDEGLKGYESLRESKVHEHVDKLWPGTNVQMALQRARNDSLCLSDEQQAHLAPWIRWSDEMTAHPWLSTSSFLRNLQKDATVAGPILRETVMDFFYNPRMTQQAAETPSHTALRSYEIDLHAQTWGEIQQLSNEYRSLYSQETFKTLRYSKTGRELAAQVAITQYYERKCKDKNLSSRDLQESFAVYGRQAYANLKNYGLDELADSLWPEVDKTRVLGLMTRSMDSFFEEELGEMPAWEALCIGLQTTEGGSL